MGKKDDRRLFCDDRLKPATVDGQIGSERVGVNISSRADFNLEHMTVGFLGILPVNDAEYSSLARFLDVGASELKQHFLA